VYTNNTHRRYVKVIKSSERDLYSLLEAYGPNPSFDDMAWYGLSYTKIHEVFGDPIFLKDAVDIYNWIWQNGWDTSGTCSGGFWFDTSMMSKQTITNAQMLQLAARMYRITNQTKYKSDMNKVYNYIMKNHLINTTTYLVTDGALFNCTPCSFYGPSYNSGVMIGALTEMYIVTNKTELLDLAFKVAYAIFEHRCDSNGVLVEYCHPDCDEDALMYKGLFARNLRYLTDAMKDPSKLEFLRGWLDIQVESNIKNNICDEQHLSKCNVTFKDGPPYYNSSGPVFSPDWRGPFTFGSPIPQTSVLDLLVAAIKPGTRCTGSFCNYDPYYPPPTSMTCDDYPCPDGEDCCEYSPYSSYTCCYTNQHCNKTTGICDNN